MLASAHARYSKKILMPAGAITRLLWPWLLVVAALPALARTLPVTEVAPGVFLHEGVHEEFGEGYRGDIANIGFVIGEQAIAVIDTGGSFRVGQALREAIRARSALPIRYVINTHVHSDHVFGNAAFAQDRPQFIGHERLAGAMRARAEAYESNLGKMLGEQAAGSRIVLPTQTVTPGQTLVLDLGQRTLQLRAWAPAHSDHDLTVLDESTRTLWMGDLLFVERTPSIEGDVRGWLAIMTELAAMSVRRSIPGHGPLVVDKAAALERQRRYLQTLIDDLKQGIAAGRPMAEVIGAAAQSERGRWQLFDSVNLRNAELLYPLLEWE